MNLSPIPPGNPETILTDPVYIFDVEMVPCPPGTPAAPRPPDRPRIVPDIDEPLGPGSVFFFDDKGPTSPQ